MLTARPGKPSAECTRTRTNNQPPRRQTPTSTGTTTMHDATGQCNRHNLGGTGDTVEQPQQSATRCHTIDTAVNAAAPAWRICHQTTLISTRGRSAPCTTASLLLRTDIQRAYSPPDEAIAATEDTPHSSANYRCFVVASWNSSRSHDRQRWLTAASTAAAAARCRAGTSTPAHMPAS
jgi:hypothetical protein